MPTVDPFALATHISPMMMAPLPPAWVAGLAGWTQAKALRDLAMRGQDMGKNGLARNGLARNELPDKTQSDCMCVLSSVQKKLGHND